MDVRALKGAVYKRFRSIKEFSETLGWSYSKISRIFSRKYIPDVVEAAEIKRVLSLTDAEYMDIFCSSKYQSEINCAIGIEA